ncbi:MAG: hypothetical protein PHE88_06585 [Elusimicrobia bacterium]|nr:hypothetical protein [Elusimicrobiota bacterium]
MFKDDKSRVLGIWDLNISPLSLGGMLILIEELQTRCIINKIGFADICIVGDIPGLKFPDKIFPGKDSVVLLDKKLTTFSPFLSAIVNMKGIDKFYVSSTSEGLQNLIDSNLYYTWPLFNERQGLKYIYGSTLYIQDYFKKYGFIPRLSCEDQSLKWAISFIKDHVGSDMPIAVHLKNKPNEMANRSNADFDVWLNFFNSCYRNYGAKFILIGDEKIDDRMTGLPNVLVSRYFDSNLSRDLALVQVSFAFMGMASGPCAMALFNEAPYVVFKNPGHHNQEMLSELGSADKFLFAGQFQKILRKFETEEILMAEFTCIYNGVNHENWGKQFIEQE